MLNAEGKSVNRSMAEELESPRCLWVVFMMYVLHCQHLSQLNMPTEVGPFESV